MAGDASAAMAACDRQNASCASASALGIVVQGRPFVPFGMYYELNWQEQALPKPERARVIKDAVSDMAAHNVNLMVLYWCDPDYCQEVLDHAAEKGVKVMIYDEYVGSFEEIARRFKDHPALFGYYISDDSNAGTTPGCRGKESKWRQNGETLRAAIRAIDPAHPTYISPGGRSTVDAMEQTRKGQPAPLDCADMIGSQTYPVWAATGYSEPFDSVYRNGLASRALADRHDQAYLHNLQTFRQFEVAYDPTAVPSPLQVRNMAYQALAAGAQGFVSFIYSMDGWRLPDHQELWAAVGQLGGEVRGASAFFANPSATVRLSTNDGAIVAALLSRRANPRVKLVLIINTERETRPFVVSLPDQFPAVKATLKYNTDAIVGRVMFPVEGHTLTGTIAGHDVLVLRIDCPACV